LKYIAPDLYNYITIYNALSIINIAISTFFGTMFSLLSFFNSYYIIIQSMSKDLAFAPMYNSISVASLYQLELMIK